MTINCEFSLNGLKGLVDRRQSLKKADHCFPFDKGTSQLLKLKIMGDSEWNGMANESNGKWNGMERVLI